MISTILNSIHLILFVFLGYITLRKAQNTKVNWSLFYALLYTIVVLPIVNYLCVELDFWEYKKSNVISFPLDLYFIWTITWSILPFYFFKGKYTLLIGLFLCWIDLLLMPVLENYNILTLHKNWIVGEILMISLVFVPSYYWAKINYQKKQTGIRALFQILIMTLTFLVILPFTLKVYGLIKELDFHFSAIEFQLFFIVVFPSLVAVNDLVTKGKGTPFPYDKTQYLVKSGVYAYCRNPIQWSFTVMFVPLALFYESYYLLLGSFISIAYTIGVSDYQEYQDMENRFEKKWVNYKNNVPKWGFLWQPKHIPKGTIYFDFDCGICSSIKDWFLNQNTVNLEIKKATSYKGSELLQATYVDYLGNEYKSIKAIAHALEHINLAYACLGWFLRFPVFSAMFQIIIDTMNFNEKTCNIK